MRPGAGFILTHRKGAALGLWTGQNPKVGKPVLEDDGRRIVSRLESWCRVLGFEKVPSLGPEALQLLAALERPLIEREGHDPSTAAWESGFESGFAYFLTREPTTESLWKGYRSLLARARCREDELPNLVVSAGPSGSFTGLRVGASFAAGLLVGRERPLFLSPTLSPDELVTLFGQSAQGGASGEGAASRAYAAPVQGCELWLSLATYLADLLEPGPAEGIRYASLPGPVLKLQQKHGIGT